MKTVTLGKIANITSGGTPSRKEKSYWGGNIPWVTTSLIQNKTITADDIEEWITEEGMKKSSAKMVPAGTILMAMYGQGKTRGQVAILDINATINQACAAISINSDVDRDFVYQQLLYRYDDIRKLSNSGGQENLSSGLIKRIAFPIGSMKEQKKIAAILTNTDHAIEITERLIAAKERYFDGLAKQLLDDAPHWQKNTLENMFQFIKGQDLSKEKLCENGAYACILYGELYTTYDEVIINVKSKTNCNEGIPSKVDDVLIPASTTTTAYDLAVASVVKEDNVLLGGDINILRKKNQEIDGAFIAYYLTHSKKTDIARYAQGITIIHLYPKDFRHIEIAFPTIEEQYKIVEVLNNAKSEIGLLKKLAESYRLQKRGLMQKLLSGELHLDRQKVS